jgi:hypothetical protein
MNLPNHHVIYEIRGKIESGAVIELPSVLPPQGTLITLVNPAAHQAHASCIIGSPAILDRLFDILIVIISVAIRHVYCYANDHREDQQ